MAENGAVELNLDNVFSFLFVPFSILFAGIFSLITNNIADEEIDKISNPARPSVTKSIPSGHYLVLAWISLGLAVVYSAAAGYAMLFCVLVVTGNYYLYSMRPLRLKRVAVASKVIISGNSLILVLAGYYLVNEKFDSFPVSFCLATLPLLFFFTVAVNFIDLKDYEGDKIAGFKTLPVLVGLRKSKMIIGACFFLAYISTYFVFMNTYLLVGSIAIGASQYFLISRERYSEKPVFIVYLLSIAGIILCLILLEKDYLIG
jgi:4-hydroxybenzoate polyprenyltransferase